MNIRVWAIMTNGNMNGNICIVCMTTGMVWEISMGKVSMRMKMISMQLSMTKQ